MSTGHHLNIQPTELKFPFELRKQSSCSLHLTNKTDQYVTFKVKTTNPKKYCVRPNTGVILPGMTCDITVTMQAQKEAPPDIQCKDKFLVQSVVVPDGVTTKDLTPDMFNKEEGKVMEEFKLGVVYIFANPPSPVPEEAEEGSSPSMNIQENRCDALLASAVTKSLGQVTRSLGDPKDKSSEVQPMISKLSEEKDSAIQQNQRLRQELDLLKKEIGKKQSGGFSLSFVVLAAIVGILIGYLLKRM
ncbi:Vesicle-associated protein 1-3 [Ancistrocladus abbreviatus]